MPNPVKDINNTFNMKIGYARVLIKDQKLEMQTEALQKAGLFVSIGMCTRVSIQQYTILSKKSKMITVRYNLIILGEITT